MTKEKWVQWILWRLADAEGEELMRIYYLICGFLTRPGRTQRP